MTRNEFDRLLTLVSEIGADAAYEAVLAAEEEERQAAYEADLDAGRDCDDRRYVAGCGEYDTVDAKGRPLLSRYNEAGEPRW